MKSQLLFLKVCCPPPGYHRAPPPSSGPESRQRMLRWLAVFVDVEAAASSIGEGVVRDPVLCPTGGLAEKTKY